MRPARVDASGVYLAVERGAVAPEGETALPRLAGPPAFVRRVDVLTRLAPEHVALDEPVREEPLLRVAIDERRRRGLPHLGRQRGKRDVGSWLDAGHGKHPHCRRAG